MAAIPGVSRVQLNFAAARLTVTGTVDARLVQERARAHSILAATGREPAHSLLRSNPHLIPTAVAAALALLGQGAELALQGRAIPASGVAGVASPDWAPILLYLGAILAGGWSTARKGLRALSRLEFDVNVLMAVAVAGAVAIGQWGEGATVAVLFGVSEALEAFTLDRARKSIRQLMGEAPRSARVKRGDAGVDVPADQVQIGETMLVRPGEKLAMDGVVEAGRSAVNQSAITGESMPVEKGPGDEVFAGTLNGHGGLEVRVTRLVADTTLSRLIHMVEEAQGRRAPTQTFLERFARWYTPTVMVLAALVVTVPPAFLGQPWSPWLYRGLALLVVSCPCALVLSTPVAIVAAISNAARNGVLIKGGAHLERVGGLRAFAFDKTGTLTRGRPEVTAVCSLAEDVTEREVLELAAAVEAQSEHPLAAAVLRRWQQGGGGTAAAAGSFEAVPGRGARAEVGGRMVYVGNSHLFANLGVSPGHGTEAVTAWQTAGQTVMLVGTGDRLLGAIALADTPRSEGLAALNGLREAGVKHTVMLTGDNAATAVAIGRQLGLDEVRSELLPEAKVAAVRHLAGLYGSVAMVGDGINDAPALAAATLGIAMGGAGSDVALETADIALMGDDLTKLPFAMRLSQATLRIIRQNITVALGLKLLAVAAIAPGWLTLWLAVLADMGATILVTLNSMRLLRMESR